MAGERVNDYSKRPGRSSIPRLRAKQGEPVELLQTLRQNGADSRERDEMSEVWGARRGQGRTVKLSSNRSW